MKQTEFISKSIMHQKDFNVLIDGKPFLDIPIRIKEEAYEQIIEMSRNNNY